MLSFIHTFQASKVLESRQSRGESALGLPRGLLDVLRVLHVSTQVVGPVLVVLPVVLEPVHMYLGRAKDGEGGGKEGEGRRSVFLM